MELTMDYNSRQILNLIREQEALSRVEISERLEIPQPTVTRITNKLMKSNLLKEGKQGISSGGRRPTKLEFNENCYYALGIELGRSAIKAALINLNGYLLSFRMKVTHGTESIDQVIEFVKEAVEEVMEESNIAKDRILGAGVGMPGPLNETVDHNVSPPNFYQEKSIPLKSLLEEAIQLPVTLDNDANAATLAEKWFGDGVGINNFSYVLADIGIGCGLMINDSLYRGLNGESGELGHMSINFPGELCHCGNYGCLETLSSLPAIEKNYKKMLNHKTGSSQSDQTITPFEDIIKEANDGSMIAQQVLDQATQYLGIAISNLINLFAPQKVIIGGEFRKVNTHAFDKIHSTIESRVMGKSGKGIPIVKSKIEEAVVLGAGALVINEKFSLSLNYRTRQT
ncbi:ROK family transcriptional regulator [Halobacillus sp. BBL2006]|uniref:ROK family transcriptional regulator n=1 Tax=Halobacillus sp. BBL2006 TaxID=1543706 RepID=UPI000543C6B8|nr:ROK family transcriptional regulator [Halobacillus sp. BBL2006]KHE67914.1 hypothetical protein LD39_15715 [Halobacillus sp. BBL2006]